MNLGKRIKWILGIIFGDYEKNICKKKEKMKRWTGKAGRPVG